MSNFNPLQTLQAFQQIPQMTPGAIDLQKKMQNLQLQQGQQGLRAGEQKLQQGAANQKLQQAKIAGLLGKALENLPQEQWRPVLESFSDVIGPFEEGDDSPENLKQAISVFDGLFGEKDDKTKQLQKGKTVLVNTNQGQAFATSVFNPETGQTETSLSPIQGNLISALGETRQEQMRSRTIEASQKAEAAGLSKEVAKSIGEKVSNGLLAADSTAILRRSKDLLSEIKTGGFSAVSLKAKQLFGVEGADEGELSFNLAKNVLQQLKPTFGAAFTKAEKDSLDSIEARVGKSTEANIRLIEQALKIANRASRRGISAAERGGDQFSFEAQEIRDALEFDLTPQNDQSTQQPQRSGGQIMIDANGNRAMVYPDGSFEEL